MDFTAYMHPFMCFRQDFIHECILRHNLILSTRKASRPTLPYPLAQFASCTRFSSSLPQNQRRCTSLWSSLLTSTVVAHPFPLNAGRAATGPHAATTRGCGGATVLQGINDRRQAHAGTTSSTCWHLDGRVLQPREWSVVMGMTACCKHGRRVLKR